MSDHSKISDQINEYGDMLVTISPGCGSDIASQRLDVLDREATFFALNSPLEGTFIDAGCGLGVQALRFALLNRNTLAVDCADLKEHFLSITKSLNLNNLRFLQYKIQNIDKHLVNLRVSCLFSQRTMHYLSYREALLFLNFIYKIMDVGGKVYLSASGLDSELGEGYTNADLPIELRFSTLSKKMAKKHGIYEPVCLYRLNDLSSLLTKVGFTTEEIFVSKFGNIKGIFKKE